MHGYVKQATTDTRIHGNIKKWMHARTYGIGRVSTTCITVCIHEHTRAYMSDNPMQRQGHSNDAPVYTRNALHCNARTTTPPTTDTPSRRCPWRRVPLHCNTHPAQPYTPVPRESLLQCTLAWEYTQLHSYTKTDTAATATVAPLSLPYSPAPSQPHRPWGGVPQRGVRDSVGVTCIAAPARRLVCGCHVWCVGLLRWCLGVLCRASTRRIPRALAFHALAYI